MLHQPHHKGEADEAQQHLQLSEELMGCAHGILFLGVGGGGLVGLVVVFFAHVLSFYPGYVRGKRVMTQKY